MGFQNNSQNIISGTNLNKSFYKTLVLNNCSFTIQRGLITTIIGKSGCGKTTLLKCIQGIEKVDSGIVSINFNEQNISFNEANYGSYFGCVLQGGFLWRRKTVIENLIIAPIILKKASKKDLIEQGLKLLEKFGIGNKANNYPEQLSGGEQQRVAIARALILSPKILLLDEITFSLDPYNKAEILKLLLDLKQDGYTIILVSHDINFSKKISDKILLMENGKIIEELEKEHFDTGNSKVNEFLKVGL